MTFIPTKTKRLYREVADQIADQIATGVYKTGARLPAERELATNFAVSRATIREALIALEISGLVDIRTSSGIFVIADNSDPATAMADDIGPGPFELAEARGIVEGEAAALAALRISERELDELERACREMAALIGRGLNAEEPDQRFHHIIAVATRNSPLVTTIERMWAMRTAMPMWRKLHQVISDFEGASYWTFDEPVIADHRRILDALRARDPDGARQAMRLHLEHVREYLLRASEMDALDLVTPALEPVQ